MGCKECGKIYKHPDSLRRHELRHARFTCEICGYTGLKKRYTSHMHQWHTPNHLKPHICSVCHKGFSHLNRLKDHMNTHTGEKPYKCPQCPATFANLGTMNGHVRGTH